MLFRSSPNSFYPVNPAQTEILYNTAVRMAGLTGRETVIDAYCGIGTIGICAIPFLRRDHRSVAPHLANPVPSLQMLRFSAFIPDNSCEAL